LESNLKGSTEEEEVMNGTIRHSIENSMENEIQRLKSSLYRYLWKLFSGNRVGVTAARYEVLVE